MPDRWPRHRETHAFEAVAYPEGQPRRYAKRRRSRLWTALAWAIVVAGAIAFVWFVGQR